MLDQGLLDEVVRVSSHDSVDYARRLALQEGLMCGISSGAAVAAALRCTPVAAAPRVACTAHPAA